MTLDAPSDLPRWSRDEVAVVVFGLAFVVLASFPWFEARVGSDEVSYRAWDLGISGVPAVVASLYAAARTAWLKWRPLKPEVPIAPGVEPMAAALIAMVLTVYRSVDVPSVPLASSVQRTIWLSVALFAVVLQGVCALRVVARTGVRA